MSAAQWKPGDVAMVDSLGHPTVCMWTGDDCQPVASGNGTHPRQPHSNGSLAAAYRRANDRMYAFLREHMSVEEIRELDQGLTVYDRLVTDVMERATWGGAE